MSLTVGRTKPTGRLQLEVIRGTRAKHPLTFRRFVSDALPRPGLDRGVAAWRARNLPNLFRGAARVAIAKLFRIPTHYGVLYLVAATGGRRINLGLASMRVVTDAGVAAIVDAFQNTVELENFKYHGWGTGVTAEAAGQTALVTELTTEYVVNNTRPTGTLAEGATANIFQTVATLAPDSGGVIPITEHAVFSQASNAGGTMIDRSKFAAYNLDSANGDSITATYELTFSSGG